MEEVWPESYPEQQVSKVINHNFYVKIFVIRLSVMEVLFSSYK